MIRTRPLVFSFIATAFIFITCTLIVIGWYAHNDFLKSIALVAAVFVFASVVLLLNYFKNENRSWGGIMEHTGEKGSEKRYRYLFENNPLPMWIINLNTFQFLDVNEMAILQYGYSREEFLSMTALDIRPENEIELFKQMDHSYRTNASNYNRGLWNHKKKDGTIIQVEIIAHEMDFGGIAARFILANDITEKRKAEEKLISNEKRFRQTLDNMMEGAQIVDFDWRYVYMNDAFVKHGKYRKEEMLGHTVMEKYPGIEKAEIFKVYQRCFNERISIHLENEFTFPDHSKGWFELSFQPVPEGIFILSIDITERKKAEEAIIRAETNYREIFEKASDAIYVHEIGTGKVLEVNQRATEITGYTKEEIIHANPLDFITNDPQYTMQHAIEYLQKAASGEAQLFEWLGKNKDGSYTWLEVNLKRARIAGEERILAFFREINDRKKVQFEIQKLNEELEQKVMDRTQQLEKVNGELEAFSYSVSHDLRAPLRGIVGFTSMLEHKYADTLDDEGKRIVSVITKNTLKMGNLIDDLLDFFRMSRQDIIKADIQTDQLVKEVISDIDNGKSNISWNIQSLPTTYADINSLRQVWINLISNAIKYSRNEVEPLIEIGYSHEKEQVIFFVKDNGVGFDPRYKGKLFKVFQRLHGTNEFEGTGVGLAIVEKIISRHGGKVWVTAEKGAGATFYFSLPPK